MHIFASPAQGGEELVLTPDESRLVQIAVQSSTDFMMQTNAADDHVTILDFLSQTGRLKILTELGFQTTAFIASQDVSKYAPYVNRCVDNLQQLDEVLTHWLEKPSLRDDLDFEADGLVIKVSQSIS